MTAFIKKILIRLNWILVVFTLLCYLNTFLAPDSFFIFPVMGLLFPILFFLNCFFILLWLFQDVKWMIPSAFVLLLGWNHINGFIGLNSNGDLNPDELTIMAFNAHYFQEAKQAYKEQTSNRIATYFYEQDHLDIICLQEFNTLYENSIMERLKGYEMVRLGKKRAVIISKYPVINKGEVAFGTNVNSCVWADLKVGEDTLRVYSVHLKSSSISGDANQVLDNIDIQQKKTWKGVMGLLTKYRGSAIVRTDQIKLILSHMDKCPYPIIAAGDFNEPPTSYAYQLISQKLTDAFHERAEGIGSTYRGRLPFLRIDYIMVSDTWNVLHYDTYNQVTFSDHLPIIASMALDREK